MDDRQPFDVVLGQMAETLITYAVKLPESERAAILKGTPPHEIVDELDKVVAAAGWTPPEIIRAALANPLMALLAVKTAGDAAGVDVSQLTSLVKSVMSARNTK